MSTQSTVSQHLLLRRSREALGALGLQFLLGMGANLVGAPEENMGTAKVIAGIVLGLHVLIGIGVVVAAVRLWMAARREQVGSTEALWAFVVVVVTFLSGAATMMTGNGWLSFVMAAGFLVSAALYVRTALLGARAARILA